MDHQKILKMVTKFEFYHAFTVFRPIRPISTTLQKPLDFEVWSSKSRFSPNTADLGIGMSYREEFLQNIFFENSRQP